MLAILWPLLIYWLVFFVACYTICEVAQDQLYDEVTPYVAVKVAGGSFIFAALATYFRPSFDTMFTNDIAWTVLQAMVWVAVFIFVFVFHPWHGLLLALVTMPLVAGLGTMGVENLTKPRAVTAPVQSKGAPPIRKSLNSAEPPKEAAPAAPAAK
jgi:hypothetical protein